MRYYLDPLIAVLIPEGSPTRLGHLTIPEAKMWVGCHLLQHEIVITCTEEGGFELTYAVPVAFPHTLAVYLLVDSTLSLESEGIYIHTCTFVHFT